MAKMSIPCQGKFIGCHFEIDSNGQPMFYKGSRCHKLDRKRLKLLLDCANQQTSSWVPLVNRETGEEVDCHVHVLHKNGNELDNRLENLILRTQLGSHPKSYRYRIGDGPYKHATNEDEREICALYGKSYDCKRLDIFRGNAPNYIDEEGYDRIWFHEDDLKRIQTAVRQFQENQGAKLTLIGKHQRPIYVNPKGFIMLETEGVVRMPIASRIRESFHTEWCGERMDRVVWKLFKSDPIPNEIHHDLTTGLIMYKSSNGVSPTTPISITYEDWIKAKRPVVRVLYSNDLSTLSDKPIDESMQYYKSKFDNGYFQEIPHALCIYFHQISTGIVLETNVI